MLLLVHNTLYNTWHMAEGEQQPSKDQNEGKWQYRPEDSSASISFGTSDDGGAKGLANDTVEWTASEFIAHPKNPSWFAALGIATLLVAAGLYFITHGIIATIVVILMGIILAVAASRQPRIVTYQLDRGGLTIEKQFHPYGKFKSFAIVDEGAFSSITLLPLRRFDLPLSMYFSPEDEHKIMEAISKYLPAERGALSGVDRLMRTIHF